VTEEALATPGSASLVLAGELPRAGAADRCSNVAEPLMAGLVVSTFN
jgi:hypothetical protein